MGNFRADVEDDQSFGDFVASCLRSLIDRNRWNLLALQSAIIRIQKIDRESSSEAPTRRAQKHFHSYQQTVTNNPSLFKVPTYLHLPTYTI